MDVDDGPQGPHGLTLRLARLLRRVETTLAPTLARLDLTFEHWRLIAAMAAAPGRPMSWIAESAALPAPTVSRYVDRLVQRGLVLRKPDEHDRRRVVIVLSAAGQAVHERLRALEVEVEAAVGAEAAAGEAGADLVPEVLPGAALARSGSGPAGRS